jgi:transcriptional regulator with XRE-family HTH domain
MVKTANAFIVGRMANRRGIKRAPKHRTFIRAWRNHRKLTIEQLAGRTDISVATLSRIESGKQLYNQGHLEIISEALNCKPEDLLGFDPATFSYEAWQVIQGAKPAERLQMERVIKALSDKVA